MVLINLAPPLAGRYFLPAGMATLDSSTLPLPPPWASAALNDVGSSGSDLCPLQQSSHLPPYPAAISLGRRVALHTLQLTYVVMVDGIDWS